MTQSSIIATPGKLFVIFLSAPSVSELNFRKDGELIYSPLLATTASEECVPMGEGCFHPQLGFVKVQPLKKIAKKQKEKEYELKNFNSSDVSLVNCEKGNFFDIFCGREKEMARKSGGLEVWVDTSSSMRVMDYSKESSFCNRRSFITKIKSSCQKMNVSIFDTSKKSLGDLSSLCINYGLNDQDRIMRWIKSSKAKVLYLVTDINEMSRKFRDFLDTEGATLYGADTEMVTSKDLVEKMGQKVIDVCQKIK